jgi:hypothetical protein
VLLLLFSLGVEVGQVAVVLAAAVATALISRVAQESVGAARHRSYFETAAIYVIGALAACWCAERATNW